MIASVRGTLIAIAADHAVIETGGVGWLIYAPRQVLAALGAIGTEARLFTHLLVREDSLTLYGFDSVEQRQLFETLLGVTGVGPQAALNLLSSGTTDEIRLAIAAGDVARLARTPRIGKKTGGTAGARVEGQTRYQGVADCYGSVTGSRRSECRTVGNARQPGVQQRRGGHGNCGASARCAARSRRTPAPSAAILRRTVRHMRH